MCVRAPLLGRREVSVIRTKSGVGKSRRETLSIREGLFRPAFLTIRVRKESCSVGSAPLGWGRSGECECTSGAAAGVIGGELGLPSEARDPGEKFP